jgi:hypothetical protein
MSVSERVVGIRSACIAAAPHEFFVWLGIVAYSPSEQRYSRMEDLRTARPSAEREKGVRPEPFSCTSIVLSGSSGCGVTTARVSKQETNRAKIDALTDGDGTPVAELASPAPELVAAVPDRPRSEGDGRVGGGHERRVPAEDVDKFCARAHGVLIRRRRRLLVLEFARERRRAKEVERVADVQMWEAVFQAGLGEPDEL